MPCAETVVPRYTPTGTCSKTAIVTEWGSCTLTRSDRTNGYRETTAHRRGRSISIVVIRSAVWTSVWRIVPAHAGDGDALHRDQRGPPHPDEGAGEQGDQHEQPRQPPYQPASSAGARRAQPGQAAEQPAAGGGAHERRHSSGRPTGPSVWTSGSSVIPNRSRTRSRAAVMTPSTSAVLAAPSLTTKFACFSEIEAPPTRRPRQPAASSSMPALRPSARGSRGFLNVEPNVLIPEGCAARRRSRISASVALTASGSVGVSANRARATISPGPIAERR